MAFRKFFNRKMKWENIVAVAGIVYLLQQDFANGSGSTPGAPVYGASWTNSAGTWLFDNTSPALPQGGNNAKASASLTSAVAYTTFSSLSEIWCYFQFRVNQAPVSGNRNIFSIRDNTGTDLVMAQLQTDLTLKLINGAFDGKQAVTSALSANTNYHVWIHYKSADRMEIAISTDGTLGSYVTATGISENNNCFQVAISGQDDNATICYFDHIIADTKAIGSNP